ncbi:MAG: DUF2064 domain-containing protein [Saprospiraceae bacterium]|nr:DUF2064 domain-containing protein [Saprospiraceae bacterium]
MMNPDCGTAILYFSLSPKAQAQSKQWKGVSPALARKTQSKLFHHTESIIKKSGLPCIHSDENNQRGDDFGSKLSNAMEDVFSLGYNSVIVLGNDCPELNQDIIQSADQYLKRSQIVIGPSQSGGVYLMGIEQSNFEKIAFQKLPWQSKELQAALLGYFNKYSAETALLPFLANLNHHRELSIFTGLKRIHRSLVLVFQALLKCLQRHSFQLKSLQSSFFLSPSISHRGPPAVC